MSGSAKATVQVDNEHVRVTEWRFAPGEATGWHRHGYDYVVVPMTTGPLRIKSAQGDVRVLGTEGAGRPARPGDRVSPIDRISTGPDSGASLVLRDGTTLVLGPESRLDLKQFHFDATTQEGGILVSLLRGSLRMITGLIGKTQPDAVRVETQTATIGIRGTDFIVTDSGQP